MKNMDPRKELTPLSGQWKTSDDIAVSDVEKTDIYRSSQEPSYVSWAVLWKESGGALKLSFTEVLGDPASWPPVYDFNAEGIQYYVKTLVSNDEGRSWEDTLWREDLHGIPHGNSDHKVRVVTQLEDGTLIRNSWRANGDTVMRYEIIYDKSKEIEDFPFLVKGPMALPALATSTGKSSDGGKTWEEINLYRGKTPFLADAIHQLKDGSVVATGALLHDWSRSETYQVVLVESQDGGHTWSAPHVIAENDDDLAPQIMGEESDFVELSDGRLLLIERTDGAGMNMVQMYVSRDPHGKWQATRPTTNPAFLHSGFPHMCRATDGTIFCYLITGMIYTCDDGATWKSLPLGHSYYGEIIESSPGRMVAVTQKHIGDCCFPWRHDTAMLQTTFHYERFGVAEQTDADRIGAVAMLGDGALEDFHLCAEVRVDGEAGVAFKVNEDTYGFVAVVIPCNVFRAPGGAGGTGQDAIMMIGRSDAGRLVVLRKQGIGKVIPGSWIEVQVDRSGGILKTAVKTAADRPAYYMVTAEDLGRAGGLGLFTNKSAGAFRNIRIGKGGTEIRSNWGALVG
ncbi:MAG: sialidase family protein [Candidatus Latescibacterota bacterium]